MDIREKLINIIVNTVDEENRAAAREYLKENNDITKLAINSVDYIQIIVDIELDFGIELQDELYEMSYFSFFDLLYEYVYECLTETTGGTKLLSKLREITTIEESIFQVVSEYCSADIIENLKIIRDLERINLESDTLDKILAKLNTMYHTNLNKEEFAAKELGNISYLSRYLFQKN